MGNYAEWASKVVGLGDEGKLATEEAQRYAKEKGESTSDTAADAVRHMTLAALASRENPLTGEMFMEANEMIFGRSPRANAMDRHNNALGVAKFEELPEEYRETMSDDEVAAYMREIVEEEYQYRKKNGGKPSGKGPKFYEKPLAYAEGGEVPSMTSAGRKVFQDEDGENYSEKTITFETKYGWVNMPTVDAEGEQKSQEWLEKFVEENGPVDPVTGSALDVFETVEQAVESAEDTTAEYAEEMSPEFNEGGLMAKDDYETLLGASRRYSEEPSDSAPMGLWTPEMEERANARQALEQRMAVLDMLSNGARDNKPSAEELEQYKVQKEELKRQWKDLGGRDTSVDWKDIRMAKGGVLSEDETGMPIVGYDEESGNPIPPGSDAENVRDDIPAMLSEGEFVVPADVVKWHGLKHMMEMREEAKEGLMAMHMEDQIKSPEHEVEEEEMMETSEHEMDEHGNEDYPTEMGQMSDIEYGDESLLVLMAADGGEVTSGEETTAPKQRLVRRLVRDPKTGKMIVMFVDIATGKPVARKSVQEGLADGTMETLDQTPQRMFEQMGGEMPEKSTAEEVVEGETGVAMPSASSGGSGEGVGNSEPVQRTLENNYGFIDPKQRAIAMGFAGMIPGGRVLGSWGINANNTEAVNAARAELGLDPVDTTLGVNMDAATGMVTDQMDPTDDVDVGPFSADVMMTDQIGRTARVADPDNMSTMDKIKDSKAARFFSGKNVTLDDTKDLPYETSSYLTPSEIAEKEAAGLNFQDGRWGYSKAAENIGRSTLADMSEDTFGSDLGISTVDEYGLSVATDRGRQEAMGIAAQDAELFDDDGNGRLDAQEQANMREFYGDDTDTGGGVSGGLGAPSSDRDIATTGAGSDWNSPGAGGGYTGGGNYDSNSNSGGGISGNGSDPGDGGGAISSTADGNDFDNFNKGGLAYKPKQKYASIKK
jgi:hypothetical protein